MRFYKHVILGRGSGTGVIPWHRALLSSCSLSVKLHSKHSAICKATSLAERSRVTDRLTDGRTRVIHCYSSGYASVVVNLC